MIYENKILHIEIFIFDLSKMFKIMNISFKKSADDQNVCKLTLLVKSYYDLTHLLL